ncbi:uncharacterized protein [Parasteatoda tepidariorum]|uniref:uncharacterized protein n=1 Tax=Parasteatoda tepidariorum TaxID=114398 RepID=UPI001C71B550|nr:uncharacterized protein LOC122272406 [Parasteatoda tepidariorum]
MISLPVDYDANKKSWMTVTIWEKTIRRSDRQFVKKKREVVFIADNCTAHANIPELASIELVFLSPNVTSVLQPLDQGVIENLKVNYRDDETEEEDDIPLPVLMDDLKNRGHAIKGEAEYDLIDEEIATTSEATISEIVSQAVDNDVNNSDPETVAVTQAEAFNAINVIRNFFTNHEGAVEHFEKLQNLENIVRKMKPKTRQTCINDYFK